LNQNLYLGIFNITTNGTYTISVEGMLALAGEMAVLIAVNASVPVVCTVPIPCRGWSDAVTGLSGLGIAMLLGKMLVPIHIFYADPFAAVTSGEVGNVLTANEAEIAVVTKSCTFRAVFLTVRAYSGALLTGAAVLTHQNTF
jgi:hypothetical protein